MEDTIQNVTRLRGQMSVIDCDVHIPSLRAPSGIGIYVYGILRNKFTYIYSHGHGWFSSSV